MINVNLGIIRGSTNLEIFEEELDKLPAATMIKATRGYCCCKGEKDQRLCRLRWLQSCLEDLSDARAWQILNALPNAKNPEHALVMLALNQTSVSDKTVEALLKKVDSIVGEKIARNRKDGQRFA